MRHVLKLGPIPFDDDPKAIYLSFDGTTAEQVIAATDEEGLAALVKPGDPEVSCEPALARAAEARGLPVGPPSEEAIFERGVLATLVENENVANGATDLIADFVDAFTAFLEQRPWDVLGEQEVLKLQLSRPPRTWAARVTGGNVPTLEVCADRAYLVSLAQSELDDDEDRVLELMDRATSWVVTAEPRDWAADAMEALQGHPHVPVLFKYRQGQEEVLSRADVIMLTAALDAVVRVASGDAGKGFGGTGAEEVTALAVRDSLEAPPPAVDPFAKVGRNDPCPCGSGLKFKKCHEGRTPPQSPAATRAEAPHLLDDRLRSAVLDWARETLGAEHLLPSLEQAFGKRETSPALAIPLAAWEAPADEAGRSAAALFLEARGADLSAAERAWIEAELKARLAPWEILHVEPGVHVELVNLLTRERVTVSERSASQSLRARHAILARVGHTSAGPLVLGMHDRALAPRQADTVVRTLQREGLPAGWRTTARLAELWDEAVGLQTLTALTKSVVRNTDGDEVVLIEDTWKFKKADAGELMARLVTLPGVEVVEQSSKATVLNVIRAGNALYPGWNGTVVASLRVTKTQLVVTTNSFEREKAFEQVLLDRAGPLLSGPTRKSVPVPKVPGERDVRLDLQAGVEPLNPETIAHRWLDEPIPALGGRTPRGAALEAELRPELHLLLKELEHSPGNVPYDVPRFRRELGLDALGEPLPHDPLERMRGFERRMSDTLVDFAAPVLEGRTKRAELEQALRFAAAAWNVAASIERGDPEGQQNDFKAKVAAGQFEAGLFRHYEALLAAKRARFAGDVREIGKVEVRKDGGVLVMHRLP